MGGILKNKQETEVPLSQSTKEFREQVLKNTQLNAQLQAQEHKQSANAALDDNEKLQWNQQNLRDNEVIQQKILEQMEQSGQVIDEPKTPFQHATEVNEYYKDDDDLGDFSLGEPEIPADVEQEQSPGVELVEDAAPLEDDPHLSFEEKKKLHYHHEAPQFHHAVDDDDEEEEEKPTFEELRKKLYSGEHPKQ